MPKFANSSGVIVGATVHETLKRTFTLHNGDRCLGTRTREADGALSPTFRWLSFGDVTAWAHMLGSGLRALGVAPGEAVALHFSNRVEWVVSDYALCLHGMLCVPCHVVRIGIEAVPGCFVFSEADRDSKRRTGLR